MKTATIPAMDRMTRYFLQFCYECTDAAACETDAKCRACAEERAYDTAPAADNRCETRDFLQLQYDC